MIKIDTLAAFLRDHWSTIAADPGTFIVFASVIGTLAYAGAKSHFNGTINALREQIKLLKEKLAHSEELLAGRPSAGAPFARMTNAQFRKHALEVIEEYHLWRAGAESRQSESSRAHFSRSEQAANNAERQAIWDFQSAAYARQYEQNFADFRARFQGRLAIVREELLRRTPAAPDDDGHQLEMSVNLLMVERAVAKLEKLALRI